MVIIFIAMAEEQVLVKALSISHEYYISMGKARDMVKSKVKEHKTYSSHHETVKRMRMHNIL